MHEKDFLTQEYETPKQKFKPINFRKCKATAVILIIISGNSLTAEN